MPHPNDRDGCCDKKDSVENEVNEKYSPTLIPFLGETAKLVIEYRPSLLPIKAEKYAIGYDGNGITRDDHHASKGSMSV